MPADSAESIVKFVNLYYLKEPFMIGDPNTHLIRLMLPDSLKPIELNWIEFSYSIQLDRRISVIYRKCLVLEL